MTIEQRIRYKEVVSGKCGFPEQVEEELEGEVVDELVLRINKTLDSMTTKVDNIRKMTLKVIKPVALQVVEDSLQNLESEIRTASMMISEIIGNDGDLK